MFGETNDFDQEKVYYESDGRMFKKEPFIKQIPRYTYVSGKFIGKFYSDIERTKDEKAEYYNFKIYEAEVEIKEKSKTPKKVVEDKKAIQISTHQMPEKVDFYEIINDQKHYYKLKFENPLFHNFKFVSKLQQNEGEEAFGTIEADFYGYLTDFLEEKRYKKIYRKINLIECKDCIKTDVKTGNLERKEGLYREEYFCRGNKKTYWGDWINVDKDGGDGGSGGDGGDGEIVIVDPPPRPEIFSPCLRNLILASILTIFSLLIGFTPLFVIGLIWLFYVIYQCYFRWLRYLAYFFGILFLMGLVFSIINIDWNKKTTAYIPHPVEKITEKPQLVKVIKLIEKGKVNEIQIQRSLNWKGYNGELYSGTYTVNKSDLNQSRDFKNKLRHESGYNSIIYNLSNYDKDKLDGVYKMFDQIKVDKKLNDKQFAEMIVSFVQHIPYYAVLEGSCNENEYQDRNIKELIRQNVGRCSPNQKFGITTPVEFLATSQGDCDSRTVLLYTIFKHYNYNVAVFSSEIYSHSILGIGLPYNGLSYETSSGKYALWETTDRGFKPGILPPEIMNLNYWNISLK